MSNIDLPTVPREWSSDFKQYQRGLAQRIGLVAACSVLVLVPVFILIDLALPSHRDALWSGRGLAWPLPSLILAGVFLLLYRFRREGNWPVPLLVLLALSLIGMLAGLFVVNQASPVAPLDLALAGLLIPAVAVALMSVGGWRDILVIYGVPVLAVALYMGWSGVPAMLHAGHLVYALMAVLVGGVVAEVLHRNRIRLFKAHKQLEENALTDTLTGLMNRRAMDRQLKAELAKARRHDGQFAIILADLDQFRQINDRYGHEIGDQVLRQLASRIVDAIRVEDRIARWGGEEFLLLIPDGDGQAAHLVAERIRDAVHTSPFETSAVYLPATVSLGVAVYEGGEHLEQMVTRADDAMSRAKQRGRNRAVLAQSAGESAA